MSNPESPPPSYRATVKQEIQNVWRREEERRRRRKSESSFGTTSTMNGSSVSPSHHHHNRHIQRKQSQSFCSMVCKAWEQHVVNNATTTTTTTTITDSHTTTTTTSKTQKRHHSNTFPSVLSIMQANALVSHVERTFLDHQQQHPQEEEESATTEAAAASVSSPSNDEQPKSNQHTSSPTWSIFSSQYDFQMGLVEMARGRSRAFYMVDVATVVKRLVALKESCPPEIVPSHPSIQQPHLRDVMIEHNVRFVTDTAQDIININSQLQDADDTVAVVVSDNTLHTGKPDSYLRRFLSSRHITDKVLAIDGRPEALRTANFIERLRQRRRRLENLTRMGFSLRLPDGKTAIETWPSLLKDTITTIEELNSSKSATSNDSNNSIEYRLAGLSFDVGGFVDCSEEATGNDGSSNLQQQMATQLIDQVLQQQQKLRIDLTGFGSVPLDTSWVNWWDGLLRIHQEGSIQITVDCSNLLLPRAGALCTRIIGVRETTTTTTATVGDNNNSPSTKLNHHRHYYIDDGCYGSLYQQPTGTGGGDSNAFQPVPLLSPRQSQQTESPGGAGDREEGTMVLSTVWGPTCDGLDRVCRDIVLPKMHRDDWLVFFPSQGATAAGLDDNNNYGTAFNGFEPPDYFLCVLGYFPK